MLLPRGGKAQGGADTPQHCIPLPQGRGSEGAAQGGTCLPSMSPLNLVAHSGTCIHRQPHPDPYACNRGSFFSPAH